MPIATTVLTLGTLYPLRQLRRLPLLEGGKLSWGPEYMGDFREE
jgi:hypothetical protein